MRLMVCDVQMNVDLIVKCGKNEVNNAKTVPYFKLFLCLLHLATLPINRHVIQKLIFSRIRSKTVQCKCAIE